MPMIINDPATYSVPTGQALLYSVEEKEEITLKYRLTTGQPGTMTGEVLTRLGLAISDLPCLVYNADLTRALLGSNEGIVSTRSSLALKAGSRADELLNLQKLNKATFLSELPLIAYKEDVYDKSTLLEILEQYVGAAAVENIASRNAIIDGSKPYLWVLNPAADALLQDKTRPALYKWNSTTSSWSYIASAAVGYNPGAIGGTYHRQLISENSILEYKDWVMVDTNCTVTLPPLKVGAYVAVSTIGDADGVTIVPATNDSIYINSSTSTSDGLILCTSHSCVELFGTSRGWVISRKDGSFNVIEEDTPEETEPADVEP